MDLKGKKIVAIVAHPDDETIGCGGFLAKAASQNAICKVVLPIKRADKRGIENWSQLLIQFKNSCNHLGVIPVVTDNQVDDLTADKYIIEICTLISEYINWADIVLCHWNGDMHQAHQAISKSVELSTRPFRNAKTVLCFEIPTSTDQGFYHTFSPNCYVELNENDVQKKKMAMKEYETEIIAGRTPDNLENQMKLRGSQINSPFAEAFVITRYFIK